MLRSTWCRYAIWIAKGNLIIWIFNAVILAMLVLNSSFAYLLNSEYFSKITLLETGIALLVAGGIAFSGTVLPSKAKEQILKSESEHWSFEKLKKSEKKANRYVILALVLFVESVALSLFGF
jgi:predicted metal-binding membrane protein